MDSLIKIDAGQIVSDFESALADFLPKDTIGAISNQIRSFVPAAEVFEATAGITPLKVATELQVAIKSGSSFTGFTGGLVIPKSARVNGDLRTPNVETMYENSTTCLMVASADLSTFTFIDPQLQVLGLLTAGGVPGITSLVKAAFTGRWN